jgi:pimeloyl-ACP methyl ester carboxylesterase
MSRERVVKFGSVTPLHGVVVEPAAGVPRREVAVVLLDSGILHHVGANRLHVQLARRLAGLGYLSLRFDFSGIGDSEARRDDLSFEASAPLETKDAIDYLARTQGVEKVALMGLCSGADVAHLTALADPRVVGLGLLDPWAYQTRAYYFHYYRHRIVRPAVYVNWFRVRLERLRDRIRRATASHDPDPSMYEMPSYIREFPPRERVAAELQGFMRRGVELFCMFSGGLHEYNHIGQYQASFPEVPFGTRLREAHVPDASHVFSALEHQAEVVRELPDWLTSRFPRLAGA